MTPQTRTAAFQDGTGSPLILLHGLFGSWPIWQPLLPLLTPHHTVLAPTLAGHRGGPALAAGPLGIAPLADAVEAQMDALGWSRAHLVGNSLGGWIAAELASRGRATSVVLLSPAGGWDSERDFRRLARKMRLLSRSSRWRPVLRLTRSAGARRTLFQAAMNHGDRIAAEEAGEMMTDTRYCLVLEGLLSWIDANPILPRYHLAPVPVRVAWAERDKTIPWKQYGDAFIRRLDSAEVVKLSGVGHVPMFDNPDLIAKTILDVTSVV